MAEDLRIEFRDGKRVVPEHLFPELSGIDTFRMTYDEALKEVEKLRQQKWLGDIQHKIVFDHMSKAGRPY